MICPFRSCSDLGRAPDQNGRNGSVSCSLLLRHHKRALRVRKTRELELLNAELERRVEARTADLAIANAQLEQRVEERTREREAALAQVHEMQKMESLGQLTGGVAHDFNNLLMAVLGNLELLKKRMPDTPALKRLVDGAVAGAERGATLTKRMLAFARGRS